MAVPLPGGPDIRPAPAGRAGPQLALNARALEPNIGLYRSDPLHIPGTAGFGTAPVPAPAAALAPLSESADAELHPKAKPIEFANLFGASAARSAAPISIPGAGGTEGNGGSRGDANARAGSQLLAMSFNSLTPSMPEKAYGAVPGPALAFSAGFLASPADKDQAAKLREPAASGLIPQPAESATVQIFGGLAATEAPAAPAAPKPQSRSDTLATLHHTEVAHVALWSAVTPRGQAMTRDEAITKVESAEGTSKFVVVPLPE